MVDADAEIAALGSAALVGQANRQAALALPDRLAVGAMAAGVALHDAAHFGVGVFLDVEQGVFHGSFLRLFGNPFLAGFEAGLALAAAYCPRPAKAFYVAFHIEPVLRVGHDAVFLLLGHGFICCICR